YSTIVAPSSFLANSFALRLQRAAWIFVFISKLLQGERQSASPTTVRDGPRCTDRERSCLWSSSLNARAVPKPMTGGVRMVGPRGKRAQTMCPLPLTVEKDFWFSEKCYWPSIPADCPCLTG